MDFGKTFKFTREKDWHLGDIVGRCHTIDELPVSLTRRLSSILANKEELNQVKETLSEYNIIEWGQHTSKMDPASKVVKNVSLCIKPEPFCTNAWCKFYELLQTLRILDNLDVQKNSTLCSVHLCEAPGGFICALQHFLSTEIRDFKHLWLANTLNPYHEECKIGEMIPDDRLLRFTYENWLFGVDDTGDIVKTVNQNDIVEQVKRRFGHKSVFLVTADGSIDCQLNPSDQESIVYPIILAETITALQLVKDGGTYVFKMFTMFEECTISLIYLIALAFDKVSIHKPITSKPGNSEVYVVCCSRNSAVNIEIILTLLRQAQELKKPALGYNELPESFIEQVGECINFFKVHQIKTIKYNLETYKNPHKVDNVDYDLNAEIFIKRMNLKRIPKKYLNNSSMGRKPWSKPPQYNLIYSSLNWYGNQSSPQNWKPRKRRLSGNYSERLSHTQMHMLAELLQRNLFIEQPVVFLHVRESICSAHNDLAEVLDHIRVKAVPDAVSRVVNSCFCAQNLLVDYNLLADQITDLSCQNVALEDTTDITGFVENSLGKKSCTLANETHREKCCQESHLLVTMYSADVNILEDLLMKIKSNDDMLLHNINCITRLGAGIVFLLWHCFDEVAIAGHNSRSFLPSVLFKRCILSTAELAKLKETIIKARAAVEPGHSVVELVAAPIILQCTILHKFICEINNEALMRSINSMVKKLNEM